MSRSRKPSLAWMSAPFRSVALVSLLAAAPACFLSQKSGTTKQRGAVRVVAPSAVAEPYLGMAPGGRFAVFADGIVDLPNGRIAWRAAEPVYLAFASRPHTLLREASPAVATDGPKSVELWNALSGRVESSFAGTPLAHSELDGLMPLQDQDSLLIVDALSARELVRLPMADEALSAVLRGEELLVLSRKRAPAARVLAQETLTLQTFQWPGGVPGKKHTLKLDWRGHQPKPATEHRSGPFLHRDEQDNLGVARLFQSNAGEATEKTDLYRVALSASGQLQAAKWTSTPFSWPDGGRVAALADAGARPIPAYAMPDNVRDALGRLPRVALGGLADAQGARLLTHGEGYVCIWSLRSARREACLRVKHETARLADGGIWMQQENGRVGTWSLARGIQWQGKEDATDGAKQVNPALDCQLSARAEPGGSAITVSDSQGPRFFLYDLGPDAWLIALPDGHYVGSPDAEKKLAFYDDKGALLASEAVTESRDAARVGQVLSAAIDCAH